MGTLSDIGPAKTSSCAISTSETKLALLMFESRRYILRIEELRRPWGVVERPESMLVTVLSSRARSTPCGACGRCLEAPCGHYHIDAPSMPAVSLPGAMRCARLSQGPLQCAGQMLSAASP